MSSLDRLLFDRVQSLLDALDYWCGVGRSSAEKLLIAIAFVLAAVNLTAMWSENVLLNLIEAAGWGAAILIMQRMHRVPDKSRKTDAPADAPVRVGMAMLSVLMVIGCLLGPDEYQTGLFFLAAGDGVLVLFFYVYIADGGRGFRARVPLPHMI